MSEGTWDKAEGKLTDDKLREKESEAQKGWGEARDKADDLKDEAEDRL